MLSSRAIAVRGYGFEPFLIAVRGYWPASYTPITPPRDTSGGGIDREKHDEDLAFKAWVANARAFGERYKNAAALAAKEELRGAQAHVAAKSVPTTGASPAQPPGEKLNLVVSTSAQSSVKTVETPGNALSNVVDIEDDMLIMALMELL